MSTWATVAHVRFLHLTLRDLQRIFDGYIVLLAQTEANDRAIRSRNMPSVATKTFEDLSRQLGPDVRQANGC
jgi:hypothetical protein